MDRCAVFVDAGYLGESAKTLLTESGSGRKVRADRAALVEALADLAVKDTGLPLLRVYWYDAAPNRVPSGGPPIAVRRSPSSRRSGTTPSGRSGARASVARRSTRSCRTPQTLSR